MKTLEGAEVSAEIKEQVTQMMEGLEGPAPKPTIARVGEKPDDIPYEREAVKKVENFDLRVQAYVLPEQISDSDFKAEFGAINRDPDISGILLFRLLPKQIAETDIEKMINLGKDLDGISPVDIARVFTGDKTGFTPCTAEAVIGVLKANEIDMTGKNVTIVGRSMVVGRSLSILMLKESATVAICHARTRNLETERCRAEILVAAVGKAKMLGGRHVRQDAIVIDVDINVDKSGKLCGDMDSPSIELPVSMATPAPGGVGAVTAAAPAKHLMLAGRRQRGN